MSSSEDAPLESRLSRLQCGGCDKGATFLPGSQDLTHPDGSPLCMTNEVIVPGYEDEETERWNQAWARHVLQEDSAAAEEHRPRGTAVAILFAALLGSAFYAVLYWGAQILGLVQR